MRVADDEPVVPPQCLEPLQLQLVGAPKLLLGHGVDSDSRYLRVADADAITGGLVPPIARARQSNGMGDPQLRLEHNLHRHVDRVVAPEDIVGAAHR